MLQTWLYGSPFSLEQHSTDRVKSTGLASKEEQSLSNATGWHWTRISALMVGSLAKSSLSKESLYHQITLIFATHIKNTGLTS